MSDKRTGKKAKSIRTVAAPAGTAASAVVSDLTQHAPMKKKQGK
jgi:hypothetical protein